MNYASIDIGTNTVLLMIVELTNGMKEICDIAAITRLGEGSKKTGALSPEAMERTLDVLGNYRAIAERNQVKDIFCVGTAALREALNRDAFLKIAKEKHLLEIRVISEREEAFYTYLSVRQHLSDKKENVIIIDIGGGSTEIIYADRENFIDYISLPVGSVKLTEMFIKNDPPADDEIGLLRKFIKSILRLPFKESVQSLVGTAGTITTLGAISIGLCEWDKRRIHGLRLTYKRIDEIVHHLLTKTILERRKLPGMERGREDIIAQGMILLQEIMTYFGAAELLIDANGVRHGALCEKMALLKSQV